jgi:BlaI family penicillinase repressor
LDSAQGRLFPAPHGLPVFQKKKGTSSPTVVREMRRSNPERKRLITISPCGTRCTMTKKTQARAAIRQPLAELESEVMHAVWKIEPCSVEAVHAIVSRKRDLKETSVRSILRRLEQKGYLAHEPHGTAYVYRSTETSRSLAARAVRQLIDRFCQGSVEELVTGMVDANVLSTEEMKRLEELVRSQRKGGR